MNITMNITMAKEKESIVKQLEELVVEYQGRYYEEIKKSTELTDKMLASKDNDQFRHFMAELEDSRKDSMYLLGKIHAINESLDIVKIG